MSVKNTDSTLTSGVLDPIAATIKNPFNKKVPDIGERGKDFPNGLLILEYVKGVEQVDTILQLSGNLMPMQPFSWDGEQRLVRNYYPGNPEAAVQILGPKESDVTIKGRFKDKKYQTDDYFGVAYQYSLACDGLRKRGNLLKVAMYGVYNWVRYAYLIKSDFKMNRLSWIDYELTFMIISETRPRNNYFAAPEKNAPDQLNNQLLNDASLFQANYSAVPTSMPQSIAGLINDITSGIAANINSVTGFISTIITTVADIEASGLRAIGLIKNTRAQLSTWRRQIGAIGFGYLNLSSQSGSGSFSDTFHNISFIADIIAAIATLSFRLRQIQKQLEKAIETTPLTRYNVKDGDTLQNISMKFYGASEHWGNIYDHNHLATTVLTPGQVLEIPKL